MPFSLSRPRLRFRLSSYSALVSITLRTRSAKRTSPESIPVFYVDEYIHFIHRVMPETAEELTYNGALCESLPSLYCFHSVVLFPYPLSDLCLSHTGSPHGRGQHRIRRLVWVLFYLAWGVDRSVECSSSQRVWLHSLYALPLHSPPGRS